MIKEIILINPPSPFLIDQKSFIPLGLLYLAAALGANNIPVKVVDLSDEEEDLDAALSSYLSAKIFCISATTPQYGYAKKIKNIIKKNNSGAAVVIGGVHATSLPQECLDEGFDIVVKGEGEKAILKVIGDLSEGAVDYKILQLPYIENLDSLAFPARHLIPIKNYGYDIGGLRATTLITSRGCPYTCVFCAKDVWERGTRFHSVDYVVREIKTIIKDYGINAFLFLDDAINLDKARLLNLCKAIKPLNIKWRCYARADFNAGEILCAMKDAGCVEIGVGIESGDQKILNIVGKGSTVEKNTSFVKDCKSVGIVVNAFIMIGLPGEDYETVEKTKKWMEDARPDKFGFNIFMPYAGSPVWRDLEKYDLSIAAIPEEHSWVKGRQGEYHCYVATKALNSREILRLFGELFDYYTNLINWKPGVGKVAC